MNATYLRFEVLRTLRNRRFLIFALIFPLVLFFAIAEPNKNVVVEGIHFPLYYMTGMASWGSMTAMLSSGARIAAERQIGWVRQLKITPLSTRTYFTAKVLCGYMMAYFTIIALGIAGLIVGVHLADLEWLKLAALLSVGLVPFAVIGILLGHLMKVDSLGPALGGVTSLFALLGGSFGPIFQSGFMLTVVRDIPSYWLVRSSQSVLSPSGWPPAQFWIVIVIWTLVMSRLAGLAYRRDSKRVV
ncbi:MAG: ABC transporter permease [Acidimicrobiales bacterium]